MGRPRKIVDRDDVVQEMVTVSVPIVGTLPAGICVPRSVRRTDLSHEQANTLKRVFLALQGSNIRMANGRQIITPPDVIAYMLDCVAEKARKR